MTSDLIVLQTSKPQHVAHGTEDPMNVSMEDEQVGTGFVIHY